MGLHLNLYSSWVASERTVSFVFEFKIQSTEGPKIVIEREAGTQHAGLIQRKSVLVNFFQHRDFKNRANKRHH